MIDRQLKIPQVRKEYQPDEINVLQLQQPRTGTHIFDPAEYDSRYKRSYGRPGYDHDEVIWELPLDKRLTWLTGRQGYASLLVKNTEVWFEVL